MKQIITLLLASSIATLGSISAVVAEEIEPEDAIKYRKAVMTAIKGHNGAIKSIVTGKVPHTGRISAHLTSIQHLFDELDSLFPEGSDFGKTNAKDAVWDNPEKFTKTITDSKKALMTFQAVAAKDDLQKTASAFKKFGKGSCGGCHKSFKKKKK